MLCAVSWFWILGIALNVGLTVAAIVWVIRQGRPRREASEDDKDASS
jgi:hypothetical protein